MSQKEPKVPIPTSVCRTFMKFFLKLLPPCLSLNYLPAAQMSQTLSFFIPNLSKTFPKPSLCCWLWSFLLLTFIFRIYSSLSYRYLSPLSNVNPCVMSVIRVAEKGSLQIRRSRRWPECPNGLMWIVVHFFPLHLFFLYPLQNSFSSQVVKNLPAMQETQEMWVWSLGLEDPLEKGMAIHSGFLAWRIPWTQEPGRL